METGKSTLSQLSKQRFHEGKCTSSKTWILQIQITTKKVTLTGKALGEKKYCNVKKVCFEKKGPKVKKTFLQFMATFQNYSLTIESG